MVPFTTELNVCTPRGMVSTVGPTTVSEEPVGARLELLPNLFSLIPHTEVSTRKRAHRNAVTFGWAASYDPADVTRVEYSRGDRSVKICYTERGGLLSVREEDVSWSESGKTAQLMRVLRTR